MRHYFPPLVRLRLKHHLPLFSTVNPLLSPWAQLAQLVPEFDFPRRHAPACLHYLGPIFEPRRSEAPFPYERLDGRPLIYASLGTMLGAIPGLFGQIAQACQGLDAQLVLSLGRARPVAEVRNELAGLPDPPLVVEYAPQRDLIARSSLVISHGGLNTILESLGSGVPVVAIPVSADQPGNAARLAWSGTGAFVRFSKLTVPRLREAIQRVRSEPSFAANARRLQTAIQRSGGLDTATRIIERVLQTGKPVTREEVALWPKEPAAAAQHVPAVRSALDLKLARN